MDFYEFSATPGTQLRVTLDGDSSKPTPLTAYGVGFFPSDCPATPSTSAFTTESPAQFEFTVPADGTSIIGVTACCDFNFSGSGTIEGAYVLFVEPFELGTPTPTPTPMPSLCEGACTAVGVVTVDDIIKLVDVSLDLAEPDSCSAGHPSGDPVTTEDLILALENLLAGCPKE